MPVAAKTYLYRRPKHHVLNLINKDPKTGTLIHEGQQLISAFAGIDLAVRGVSMNNGALVECLRILRKIEKAGHREVALQYEYIEFTEAEKKIIETSVLGFGWSKHASEIGHNLWVSWMAFLEGFDPESETYKEAWLEYDPMNPPPAYVESKRRVEAAREKYEAEVRKAEEEAIAKKAAASASPSDVTEAPAGEAQAIDASPGIDPAP